VQSEKGKVGKDRKSQVVSRKAGVVRAGKDNFNVQNGKLKAEKGQTKDMIKGK
jgi:hypothetical protein